MGALSLVVLSSRVAILHKMPPTLEDRLNQMVPPTTSPTVTDGASRSSVEYLNGLGYGLSNLASVLSYILIYMKLMVMSSAALAVSHN